MGDFIYIITKLNKDGSVQPMAVNKFITHYVGGFFPQDGAARVARDQSSQGKRSEQNSKQNRDAEKDASEDVSGHGLLWFPR